MPPAAPGTGTACDIGPCDRRDVSACSTSVRYGCDADSASCSASPDADSGSALRIAALANSSWPSGLNIATASSRRSTTDSNGATEPAASCERMAVSSALNMLNELPSSPNSSPGGRSSLTSNSPRPSRLRPLLSTCTGRSVHCASSSATPLATMSAMKAV
jgi:hypothetical protein